MSERVSSDARPAHPFDFCSTETLRARKRSAPAQSGLEGIPGCKLFVHGLSSATYTQGLKQHFDRCGRVRAIDVPCDPITKKNKGYAFVTYFHPEDAALALQQLTGTYIDGKPIIVAPSIPKSSNGSSTAPQEDLTNGPRSCGSRSNGPRRCYHRSGDKWSDERNSGNSSPRPWYAAGDSLAPAAYQAPVTGPALSWAPDSRCGRILPPPPRQLLAPPATAPALRSIITSAAAATAVVPKHHSSSNSAPADARLLNSSRHQKPSVRNDDSLERSLHDADCRVELTRGKGSHLNVKIAVQAGSTSTAAAHDNLSAAADNLGATTAAIADATSISAPVQQASFAPSSAVGVGVNKQQHQQPYAAADKGQQQVAEAHGGVREPQQLPITVTKETADTPQQQFQYEGLAMGPDDDTSAPHQQQEKQQQQQQPYDDPEDGEVSSGRYMVHISQMGPQTTASDLQGFMSRAGVVTHAEVNQDLTGVAAFETIEEAEAAINMLSGAAVWGKIVSVTPLDF